MANSEKMKRELQKFWLNQLDQHKNGGVHSLTAPLPQQRSAVASHGIFQRQLRRLNRRHAAKPAANDPAVGSKRFISCEKPVDARPVATEPNQLASATDRMRQWFSRDGAAGQFEGQFYVKAVDVLSLRRAKQDWNNAPGDGDETFRSRSAGLAIDDRLMWLSAPSC